MNGMSDKTKEKNTMINLKYEILKMLDRVSDTHGMYDLRFGQILFTTGILETYEPFQISGIQAPLGFKDPFYDTDEQIVERMKKALKGKYKLTKKDNIGDLFKREKFEAMCNAGEFFNYDGFGYYATETEESDILIKPSDVILEQFIDYRIDEKLSHIMWYNR